MGISSNNLRNCSGCLFFNCSFILVCLMVGQSHSSHVLLFTIAIPTSLSSITNVSTLLYLFGKVMLPSSPFQWSCRPSTHSWKLSTEDAPSTVHYPIGSEHAWASSRSSNSCDQLPGNTSEGVHRHFRVRISAILNLEVFVTLIGQLPISLVPPRSPPTSPITNVCLRSVLRR